MMKRDKIFEQIGDEIIENLTESLFQDFEIQVGEKNDWYNYEHYIKRYLHYKNVILKIETKYKLY